MSNENDSIRKRTDQRRVSQLSDRRVMCHVGGRRVSAVVAVVVAPDDAR